MCTINPCMRIQTWENMQEMVCESTIVCGIAVWGLIEAWEQLDKVHFIFFQK
jgi:hypothetical protein